MPKYSFNNVILIIKQCPIATKLHTFRGWKKLGRCVKNGEFAIRIRAPRGVKDEWEAIQDGELTNRSSKIRWISLFDISQTVAINGEDGDDCLPVAEPIVLSYDDVKDRSLNSDVAGFDKLMKILELTTNFMVEIKTLKKKAKGACNFSTFKIYLSPDLSELHTIKTLIHEIAHYYMHGPSENKLQAKSSKRNLIEMEAESVAFIVCNYLNLDTSEYSFGYVADYKLRQKKYDTSLFLDRIQKTASFLIDFIEGITLGIDLGYTDQSEYSVITSMVRAKQIFQLGGIVYRIYPEQGESFVSTLEQIEEHKDPFLVLRSDFIELSKLIDKKEEAVTASSFLN